MRVLNKPVEPERICDAAALGGWLGRNQSKISAAYTAKIDLAVAAYFASTPVIRPPFGLPRTH